MQTIDALMRSVPVIPVLVIEDAAHAEPIARALVAGGLTALEVTLRTPAALDVIRAMSRVEGAVVGAGTVLNARDLDAAMEAGARFIVSPGLTDPLTRAAADRGVPYLPGVANAADIMRGLDHGLDRFKFFPAEAAGGIKALKALAVTTIKRSALLPDLPTMDEAGVKEKFGVPPSLIIDYLTLIGDKVDNVPGVDKCGPKTAVKWLEQYGSLAAVIDNAANVGGKVGENLRAVLDWPLGSVETTAPYTVMVNTLGAETEPSEPMEERVKEVMRRYPDAKVHLYGKDHRPGRKMGHLNLTGATAEQAREGRLVRSLHEPDELVPAAQELARSWVKGRSAA